MPEALFKLPYEECWYHERVGQIIAATHYGRHYCPRCHKIQIVAICAGCEKVYEMYNKAQSNYAWQCEDCGAEMERRVVGPV